MAQNRCPRCAIYRPDDLRWCRKCGFDFEPSSGDAAPLPAAPEGIVADRAAQFRYDKPGARVAIYADRLELTTGVLWRKKTHVVPLRAVVGVSVVGAGGHELVVQTAGRGYAVSVGIGVATKIRDKILDAMRAVG